MQNENAPRLYIAALSNAMKRLWHVHLVLDLETYYTVAHDLLKLIESLLPELGRRVFSKESHIVLVDGITGTVRLVSVYNHNNAFFSLNSLKAQYGEPVLADTINSRDHLFFAGKGIAIIVESRDNSDIWYVQLLPKEMTLGDYQEHQGYWQETFAFTP